MTVYDSSCINFINAWSHIMYKKKQPSHKKVQPMQKKVSMKNVVKF